MSWLVTAPETSRRWRRLAAGIGCAALLGVVVLAVFHRPLAYGFLKWDDEINVSKNLRLRPLGAESLLYFWRKPYVGLRIPVTYNVLSVVAHFASVDASREFPAGLNPAWFHAVNLGLHLLCACLVMLLLWRTVARLSAALLGAGLFALHPVQVEPVAWITGIKDLLSAAFALAALVLYLASVREEREADRPDAATRANLVRRTLATVLYFLALAAKPSVVTLPAIAWIMQIGLLRRSAYQGLGTLAVWLILAGVATQANKAEQGDEIVVDVAPVWARPFIATDALAFYACKLVWPVNLGADYGRSPSNVLRHGWLWWTWIVPIGALVVAAWSRWRRVGLTTIGVFAFAVLPVLGLVPFGFQMYSTVADRYLYLALLGPALGVAFAFRAGLPPWAWGAALTILGALAGQTFQQTSYWRDDVALFRHVLTTVNPQSWVARNNVGFCLQEQGELTEAERLFREAIELRPQYAEAHLNLGNLLYSRKQFAAAIEEYRQLLELQPKSGQAYFNLGNAQSQAGDFAAARATYLKAAEVSPVFRYDARLHFNLANALAELRQWTDAAAEYQLAAQILPKFFEAHLRAGRALEKAGRKLDALAEYRLAAAIEPNSTEVRQRIRELAGVPSGE